MVRVVLPLSCVLVLFAACEPPPADDAARLRAAYDEASREYAVPRPLLEAIGFLETRWVMRPGEPANDNGFGVMHLIDQGPGTPLPRAAELLGVSPEELKTDPRLNVLGAAAVLRERADAYFAATPALDEHELAHWWQVVMLHSGAVDAEVADLYATGVYRVLNDGARAPMPDGSTYYLPPTFADVDGQKLFGEIAQALDPEFPQADRYLPALRYTSGRDGQSVQYVVIHTAQGSYAGTVSWFRNQQVQASAHYVVGRNGELTQMVRHGDTAWHAGNWTYNLRSIGIEHEGFVDDPGAYTQAMYDKSAALTRFLLDAYGLPRTHPQKAWPVGPRGVIGHNEIPDPDDVDRYGGNSRHKDPCVTVDGSQCFWNWTSYMQLVGGSNTGGGPVTTGTLTGVVYSGAGGCQFIDGQGFVNCSVKVPGARVFVPETGTTAVADSGGTYQLSIPAGARSGTDTSACKRVSPRASASGFLDAEPVLDTIIVCAGETKYGSVILQPTATGTVRGLVYIVNTSNAQDRSSPVEGAQVEVGSQSTNTRADGTFSLVLPAGPRTLQFTKAGLTARPVDVTVNANRNVDIEVGMFPGGEDAQPPRITITRPAPGAIVDTNPVLVEGNVDEPVQSLQVGGVDAYGTLDAERHFAVLVPLPSMETGSFEIEAIALDASNNIGRSSVTVAFGLEQGLAGRVVNGATGDALSGALVQSGDAFVRTGDDGRFALALPSGVVSVTVQAPRFKPRVVALTVPAGGLVEQQFTLLPNTGLALLTFESPADGTVTREETIDVSGTVTLQGVDEVLVNGVEATRDATGFTATVPLQVGANTLTAVARTDDGAEVSASITVTRTKDGCGCSSTLDAAPGMLLLLAGFRRRRR